MGNAITTLELLQLIACNDPDCMFLTPRIGSYPFIHVSSVTCRLPITTDFFPDARSLNDYNLSVSAQRMWNLTNITIKVPFSNTPL